LRLTEHAVRLVVMDGGTDEDFLLGGTSDKVRSVKIEQDFVVDESLVEFLHPLESVLS
jgi:hypothetical protein